MSIAENLISIKNINGQKKDSIIVKLCIRFPVNIAKKLDT